MRIGSRMVVSMSPLEPDPGTVIDASGSCRHTLNRHQNLLGKVMLMLARQCERVLAPSPPNTRPEALSGPRRRRK